MNKWTPLWSTIVDSSVWEEDDNVCKIWVTMLALKDADHIVRYSAYQIGKKANKTEADALLALEVLSRSDARRIEPQEFDGRRVEKVEGGWLILNGEKYQRLIQEMIRQRQQAQWQREQRMIDKAVATGEGINPDVMTPALKRRYDRAKVKRKKGCLGSAETGAKDIESWVDKGTIMGDGSGGEGL